jgi:hypothetical protein
VKKQDINVDELVEMIRRQELQVPEIHRQKRGSDVGPPSAY